MCHQQANGADRRTYSYETAENARKCEARLLTAPSKPIHCRPMDTRITANANGTFTVGYVTVLTQEQAEALLVETGVFDAKSWPFVERRQHLRHVVRHDVGPTPTTYFEVTE